MTPPTRLRSMTGFAAVEGSREGLSWRWEMRSVNARGLDIRWRGPEGREALETAMRREAQARLARGSVSIALRVSEKGEESGPRLTVDEGALAALLAAARVVHEKVTAAGMPTAPVSIEAILSQRGVLERTETIPDPKAREAEDRLILQDGIRALEALAAMRAEEGARLAEVLGGQVDRIEALTEEAEAAAAARAAAQGDLLRRRLAAVLDAAGQGAPDEARLAQELAILAVKGDVREEIDRLRAHVAAARDLMGREEPVGRRLDFLTQEFNREANTLCSKADFAALTEAGLELKTIIDRLREQVQNIE